MEKFSSTVTKLHVLHYCPPLGASPAAPLCHPLLCMRDWLMMMSAYTEVSRDWKGEILRSFIVTHSPAWHALFIFRSNFPCSSLLALSFAFCFDLCLVSTPFMRLVFSWDLMESYIYFEQTETSSTSCVSVIVKCLVQLIKILPVANFMMTGKELWSAEEVERHVNI